MSKKKLTSLAVVFSTGGAKPFIIWSRQLGVGTTSTQELALFQDAIEAIDVEVDELHDVSMHKAGEIIEQARAKIDSRTVGWIFQEVQDTLDDPTRRDGEAVMVFQTLTSTREIVNHLLVMSVDHPNATLQVETEDAEKFPWAKETPRGTEPPWGSK